MEKWVRRLEYTAAALVAAAMVGWFGYSVYEKAQNSRAVSYTHLKRLLPEGNRKPGVL